MTSFLGRALRPAALVLGSAALVLGGVVPAAAAPTAAGSPTAVRGAAPTTTASGASTATGALASGVLAAGILPAKRSAKKPARVKKPKLVKNGRRHHNVRISWPWVSGAARYVVQASPKKKFRKKTNIRVVRKNPGSRPAGGRVELTVPGLKNATTYRLRVRAIAPSGAKGRWSKVRKARTKVRIPNRITSMTATPGPKPGQVTFRWKHKRKYTKHYLLELASTTFHPKGKNLPKKGRDHLRIKIPAKKKKFVLTAKRAARAGAPVGSGNHLYYRFSAVNKNKGQKKVRLLPRLHGVQPAGPAVAAASSTVDARFASYNVAYGNGQRSWGARQKRIAQSIVDRNIGVVGIQELSPGKKGQRPTTGFVKALRDAGGDFAMVRESPYYQAGTKNAGNQSARIVYDTSRYDLAWNCGETTGNREFSESCMIEMPRASGESRGRPAAFAKFRDRTTETEFWFVSLHLTPDGSGNGRRDALRERQVQHVVSEIEKLNVDGDPIILTGDLNSWQNQAPGNPPHDFLIADGFVDSFAAPRKTNPEYSTFTRWQSNPKKYGQGFGVRLDYVLVKGGAGVLRYQNVMKPADSDHNLVVADVRLPR